MTASNPYRQRVAVCVGINCYATHPQLRYAVSDAVEMANVFEAMGFDRVVLLTDEDATRMRILEEIGRFQESAKADDLFVFYFAGHGWTGRNEHGEPAGYLIPWDCERGHETSDGISMARFSAMMNRMNSRHVLLLVDACYSGYGISPANPTRNRGGRGKSLLPEPPTTGQRCIQILTAGGAMDRAFESDGHGLFTRHVLECLRGESQEAGDGFISATELAARVRHKVVTETGGWQKPRFGCEGDGDVLLAVATPSIPGTRVAMMDNSLPLPTR
ncbi:MAG: caspase family protein [Kiritimatiellae bacterium]|nr:caspase family protein [Kiritimatiellia bacterium]